VEEEGRPGGRRTGGEVWCGREGEPEEKERLVEEAADEEGRKDEDEEAVVCEVVEDEVEVDEEVEAARGRNS
jgi:hypothetical protein